MNWFRKTPLEDLRDIEQNLAGTLRPVVPRQEFVRDIRARLIAHTFQSVPVPVGRTIDRRWLFAGGALGSIFMLLTTLRGILAVIGLAALVVQYLGREKHSPTSQLAH